MLTVCFGLGPVLGGAGALPSCSSLSGGGDRPLAVTAWSGLGLWLEGPEEVLDPSLRVRESFLEEAASER